MALAGLLFDKDGTLIHFNATWNPAMLSVLQQQAKGNAAMLRRLAAALDYDLETSAFHPKAAFVAGAWGILAVIGPPHSARPMIRHLRTQPTHC